MLPRLTGIRIGLFLLLIIGLRSSVVGSESDLTLVENGVPKSTIVLADKSTKAARLAAFEIQAHVKLITGAELPIVAESEKSSDGIKIFVGPSKSAYAAGAPKDLKGQEYAIVFKKDAVIIIGNDKQDFGKLNYWHTKIPGMYDYMTWPDKFDAKGTLNATYDFLRKYCGVRWFDQSEFGTDAPKSETLKVTAKNLRRAPAFLYRDTGYIKQNMELYNRETSLWTVKWSKSTPQYQKWLEIMYPKGRKQPECKHPHHWLGYERSHVYAFLLRNKLGGEAFKTNHSFYGWYDRFWRKNPKHPERFIKAHPDWFAKGYPNEKLPPQLCYSNPEVLEQCLKDARAFFALPESERQKSRLGTDKFFPVVPMDNTNYCKCERCMKLGPAQRVSPGYSTGDHSLRVWSFVNAVAKGLKKSNPGKWVSALAYSSYARRPKNMKIEDNIAVQMCLFPHALASSPKMLKNDDEILREWADGRPLYLWLYAGITTGHKPKVPMFPKPLGANWDKLMLKYRNAGVRGLFFNGVPQETDAYFMFNFADDPDQNPDKLINDYFIRMYGPKAGPWLEKFFKLEVATYMNPRNHPPGVKGPQLYYGVLGTAPRMAKFAEYVKNAEQALTGAPELWRRRFEMFKFGTWDYMLKGRSEYEKSRVVKASKPISVVCPRSLKPVPKGDPAKVDWSDAQAFGGYNGWLKDNGDISLRSITSGMVRDGDTLFIKLTETKLDRPPRNGDSWEILARNGKTGAVYKLTIDKDAKLAGRVVVNGGAPQDWSGHNAKAVSKISKNTWSVSLALPVAKEYLDKYGRMFINIRRNDAKLADSPVLVATGNNFELAKTGALITFDKPVSAIGAPASGKDLILDWRFAGKGTTLKDSSGHGNDGIVVGAEQADGVVKFDGGVFKGEGQYLTIPKVKEVDAKNITFTCWLKYKKANTRGSRRIFTWGDYHSEVALPYRKLMLLAKRKDGKVTGAGPFGPELPPNKWIMYTMTFDGSRIAVYENGRLRGGFGIALRKLLPPEAEARWWFGGLPKLPPWYTFIGEIAGVQIYGHALSPEEILAKYGAERGKHAE